MQDPELKKPEHSDIDETCFPPPKHKKRKYDPYKEIAKDPFVAMHSHLLPKKKKPFLDDWI
jgi:hypothetical protein